MGSGAGDRRRQGHVALHLPSSVRTLYHGKELTKKSRWLKASVSLQRPGKCPVVGSSSAFPLYVVPISSIFKLDKIKSHEELKEEGVLIEWKEGMGPLLFVSHTWLGRDHPDPKGCKLGLLKEFLQNILAQQHHCLPESCGPESFIWLDYWSIPQEDAHLQSQAIRSIPAFVTASSALICLAPTAQHEDGSLRDLQAWRRRGWCRLERLSNALAPSPAPCVVVQSASSAYVCESSDWIHNPVCEGDFKDPNDKDAVAAMIEKLIDARYAKAVEDGDVPLCLFLDRIRGALLAGSRRPGGALSQRAAGPLSHGASLGLKKFIADVAPIARTVTGSWGPVCGLAVQDILDQSGRHGFGIRAQRPSWKTYGCQIPCPCPLSSADPHWTKTGRPY